MQMIEGNLPKTWKLRDTEKLQIMKKVFLAESWETTPSDVSEKIHITCGYFVCFDASIIICTHGSEDGILKYYDKILDVLTDPINEEYEIYIHCCYPKRVAEKYPELKDYLLYSNWDNVTCIGFTIGENYLITCLEEK